MNLLEHTTPKFRAMYGLRRVFAPVFKGVLDLKVHNLTAIKNRGIEAWAAEVGDIRKRYLRGSFKIGAGPQLTETK